MGRPRVALVALFQVQCFWAGVFWEIRLKLNLALGRGNSLPARKKGGEKTGSSHFMTLALLPSAAFPNLPGMFECVLDVQFS